MKRTGSHIIIIIFLVCFSGCEKKLEELYNDPDLTTQPSIEKFFTEMLNNDRMRSSYWDVRTFIVMHTGIYSQSVGFINNANVYQQNPGYTQDRWNAFYSPMAGMGGVMAHYRSIESAYAAIKDENLKKQSTVFVQAAKVVMLDQASQMVDLWGDIPFTEAGSVNLSGEIIKAKFDAAPDVYRYIIDGLKSAADYFAFAQLNAETQSSFARQDILLGGKVDHWLRYANSLRLRLLMRTSFYNEENARQEVATMLSNPTVYPLIDGSGAYDPVKTDVLLQPLTSYTDNLNNALTELFNYSAPGHLLNNVMLPAEDPRVSVWFDKYGRMVNDQFVPNTKYIGLPPLMNATEQMQQLGNYSILDSTTFLLNSKLPGIILTAPEVQFSIAEAYERWGGGDAAAAYQTALRQSVQFYFYLHNLNRPQGSIPVVPDEKQMEYFLNHPTVKYEGSREEKLRKIWTQKWVHYGFLQSGQSWAELRRTKTPALSFLPSTLTGYETPPTRLIYPSSETAFNPNYSAVKEKDFRDRKIFWDVK
jgi:hypothetical protein